LALFADRSKRSTRSKGQYQSQFLPNQVYLTCGRVWHLDIVLTNPVYICLLYDQHTVSCSILAQFVLFSLA
jgi:hypothetical protein